MIGVRVGMVAAEGREDLSGGPKLEDFLGGVGEPLGRYSGDSATTQPEAGGGGGGGIYDSDLKTIAAGFLRCPADQLEPDGKTKAAGAAEAVPEQKKAVDTFGQRTSIYRGVTRHRWTGRYEAHLWDNSCRREGQSRKGRQGGYDKEEKAARAYDLAALKYWGPTTTTNFPVSNYEKELEEMKNMTGKSSSPRCAGLSVKSSGFSRGVSMYRGVTRHHQHGRWQARIGRVAGNKDLYLGTFGTEEEAAEAYDIAAIKFRGLNAVTNFDMSRYDVKSILASNLPIGGMSGRTPTKATDSSSSSSDASKQVDGRDLDLAGGGGSSANQMFALPLRHDQQHHQQHHDYWSLLALHNQQAPPQQGQDMNSCFDLYSSGVNVDFSSPVSCSTEEGWCNTSTSSRSWARAPPGRRPHPTPPPPPLGTPMKVQGIAEGGCSRLLLPLPCMPTSRL
ncbi:unnamed protein product [Spirodela intermedia]|uniref:AP2/ERF domain-containing protein n=1 Tax=Spirodela intermedia TaxID=51605 RepID=A0A7I8JMP9_SPIIN|nr:unnamed protein product [Spirodela intermedia]CAA6671085.1 unnamed protein product [Spirodela intermedia]